MRLVASIASRPWLVPGLAAAATGLVGFAVAHSLLIPWANPRFLIGLWREGLVPALVGGLAAAWLYQRLAPRLPGRLVAGAAFGVALWLPIAPMELAAITVGPMPAGSGAAPLILALTTVLLAVAAAAGWRLAGGLAGATAAALAALPGTMFFGGGLLDMGGRGTGGGLFASLLVVYALCGVAVHMLSPSTTNRSHAGQG